MTPQELLTPRYQVIATYPNSPFLIGRILLFDEYDRVNNIYWHKYSEDEPIHLDTGDVGKYSHIFKKLEWWEQRKPDDMPLFIKLEYEYLHIKFIKLREWILINSGTIKETMIGIYGDLSMSGFDFSITTPITEEEYNNGFKSYID